MLLAYQPKLFRAFPDVVAAESTRHGGVSLAPYRSLNLGKKTDDDPKAVAENHRRFAAVLGFAPEQLAWSFQVHGDAIWQAETPGGVEGYDALITNQPNVVLAVSTADCTPILIWDKRNRAVAAIHAGWRGTVAQLVAKTLHQMAQRYGTAGTDCYAYVGTCISFDHFEVGDEVAAQFAPELKVRDAQRGKYRVDLKQANALQLLDFGVPAQQIEVSPYCTIGNQEDFFSHRASGGITGRMLSVIGVR
jgi:polyphenol oxidase